MEIGWPSHWVVIIVKKSACLSLRFPAHIISCCTISGFFVIISYNSALAYMNFLDLPLRSLHYFEIQLRELNEIGRFKRELKEFLK